MDLQQTNLIQLYLPLLVHSQPAVRRQACVILLGMYGDRALTSIRRLVDDSDPQVRQNARLALLAFAECADLPIKAQLFQGLYIECLGRLRVYIGNREILADDWDSAESGRAGSQKVQAVLAYLVHCGRHGTSRKALGAAVWSSAYSPSSLARTLSVLRQTLSRSACDSSIVEQALVLAADYCLLDPHYYHTDVQLFESAYNMAARVEQEQGLEEAAPLYRQAAALYSGPYMADVLPGSGWGQRRRDHLMNSFVIAAERLAEYRFTQQQYNQCIDICILALDADPTADDLMVWLLRACAAVGLSAELEHAYRSYARAAGLDTRSTEGSHDLVVQTYLDLGRTRAR